jgi:hypothetical protein
MPQYNNNELYFGRTDHIKHLSTFVMYVLLICTFTNVRIVIPEKLFCLDKIRIIW